MLWTHKLKNITYNDKFVLEGAPSGQSFEGDIDTIYRHSVIFILLPALTLGAGVQWHEAYDAAKNVGRIIVGGLSGSVGTTGGYIQGGEIGRAHV